MLTFIFWNLAQKPLEDAVSRLTRQHQVDILVLAECTISRGTLLQSLADANQQAFHLPYSNCRRISIYTRFSADFLTPVHETDRLTVRRLRLPARTEILMAAVHLPSKLHWSEDSQSIECTRLAETIREEERKFGHSRTLLVGDFNMNPFETGVVAARGLHAVMTKQLASRGQRTVQGEQYPFFYNPMWSRFGDNGDGPPGTYHYDRPEHVCYFWNIFDQVLVRPDLLNLFPNQELRILGDVGGKTLLSPKGLPDQAIGSDHLPVLFKLDL